MKTAKGILKILLLYLIVFWILGLLNHLVIQGAAIENTTGFIQAIFHRDVFYLYFVVAGFEVWRFLSKKRK
ncbi:MAG: Unknown protein [uncultured Aureispira sp.]|uniref:Uncharacterized protein n=1 Tax=uncultured Aureispira sp. TaxID=1331704 RepID=A0A6S6U980_9BACT|nr:MAG: Unknown protein [uncultured Aureispira sp.]